MRNRVSIGIDFGTTNTVIAIAKPGDAVRAVTFGGDREQLDIYRSVLCFEQLATSGSEVEASAGMKAIGTYLTSAYETRFIQSFKSHIASAIFDETRIFGRGYKFEDLLSAFFRLSVRDADGQLADLGGRVVSGRPVALSAPHQMRRLPFIVMERPTGASVSVIPHMSTSQSAPPITTRSVSKLTRWCWFVILGAAQAISRWFASNGAAPVSVRRSRSVTPGSP
jgi:hypothetical protein